MLLDLATKANHYFGVQNADSVLSGLQARQLQFFNEEVEVAKKNWVPSYMKAGGKRLRVFASNQIGRIDGS